MPESLTRPESLTMPESLTRPESLTMPEAVSTSRCVRNLNVCGHVNTFEEKGVCFYWPTLVNDHWTVKHSSDNTGGLHGRQLLLRIDLVCMYIGIFIWYFGFFHFGWSLFWKCIFLCPIRLMSWWLRFWSLVFTVLCWLMQWWWSLFRIWEWWFDGWQFWRGWFFWNGWVSFFVFMTWFWQKTFVLFPNFLALLIEFIIIWCKNLK